MNTDPVIEGLVTDLIDEVMVFNEEIQTIKKPSQKQNCITTHAIIWCILKKRVRITEERNDGRTTKDTIRRSRYETTSRYCCYRITGIGYWDYITNTILYDWIINEVHTILFHYR